MSDYVLNFTAISAGDLARVGGKCASLGEMTRNGFAVPPGFAVTTDAYRAHLASNGLKAKISELLKGLNSADVKKLDKASAEIRKAIESQTLPASVIEAITKSYAALGNHPVAVRSSATAEDLPDASFAGQQDTFLWVTGIESIIAKVRDCFASMYTSRAIAYRDKNKIPHGDVFMSVAVQKMVNAKAAGVAMTLDPSNGDRTKIIIDASWGLGETVVSGTVTPDNFKVEKVMEQILSRKICDKHLELVADKKAGKAVERAVDKKRRTAQCLTDAEVLAVARLAKKLEKQNKCPQDVEWAIDADLPEGENLLALQSRPETVWSQKTKAATADYGMGLMGIVNTLTTVGSTGFKK